MRNKYIPLFISREKQGQISTGKTSASWRDINYSQMQKLKFTIHHMRKRTQRSCGQFLLTSLVCLCPWPGPDSWDVVKREHTDLCNVIQVG